MKFSFEREDKVEIAVFEKRRLITAKILDNESEFGGKHLSWMSHSFQDCRVKNIEIAR